MESPGHGAGEGGSTRGAISAQRAGRIMGDTGPEFAFVHRGALPSHRALSRAGGVVVTQGAPPQSPRGRSVRCSTGVCVRTARPCTGAGVCALPLLLLLNIITSKE